MRFRSVRAFPSTSRCFSRRRLRSTPCSRSTRSSTRSASASMPAMKREPAASSACSNFDTLLTDPNWSGQFWNALRNNLIFFAIHMVVQNAIGLALAVLLSLPRLTGSSVYRTLIFLPTMLSVVIIGFIWQLILIPLWGIAPSALDGRRSRQLVRALARPGIDRAADGLADLGLAVRRHSDDADLRGAPQHSRRPDRRRDRRRRQAPSACSGSCDCRSSCRRSASSRS